MLKLSQPWLKDLRFHKNGILMKRNESFGLGTVVVIQYKDNQGKHILIRKAQKEKYEFSGKWALPGGMVRFVSKDHDILETIRVSLLNRLKKETSIEFLKSTDLTLINIVPPIVTSYTVKGKKKHTVILPFFTKIFNDFKPVPKDPSVDRAEWKIATKNWKEIAPANRIILGYFLWSYLTSNERKLAKPSLLEALYKCTEWSKEIGIAMPNLPW